MGRFWRYCSVTSLCVLTQWVYGLWGSEDVFGSVQHTEERIVQRKLLLITTPLNGSHTQGHSHGPGSNLSPALCIHTRNKMTELAD